MKPKLVPSLVAIALIWSVGIASIGSGCAKVEPGGVYQGDNILFNAEQSIVTGKQLLDTAVSWEYANRTLLAGTPQIKKSMDRIRAGAPEWFATANRLRDDYMSNPSEANRDALQKALDVINEAVREALGYLQKYGPNR